MASRKLVFLLSLMTFVGAAEAQIHPGETGATLIASLQTDYTPATVLSLAAAKDTLYKAISQKDGGVYGVYTGYFVQLDGVPNSDPSQDVYNNGAGLNMEHTWPQSLGSGSGNPRSNLHHLFPTRVDVNSARSNLPFVEIDDSDTDAWYYLNLNESTPSGSDLSLYSERDSNVGFEPRHDHKGNVARAMFYFYTIYESVADDPFFELQKFDLRQWHIDDPVDADEIARSNKVATYQSGKINPFVHDETLVDRAYFSGGLPVELISFSGSIDNNLATFSWVTESERDVMYFQIEGHGRDIESRILHEEPARGENGSGDSYAASVAILPGVTRYVLSEITNSGNRIRLDEVELAQTSQEISMSTPYPNPTSTSAEITLFAPRSEVVEVSIYDILGRRVSTLFAGTVDSGRKLSTSAANLGPGLFMIVATSDRQTVSQKLIVTD